MGLGIAVIVSREQERLSRWRYREYQLCMSDQREEELPLLVGGGETTECGKRTLFSPGQRDRNIALWQRSLLQNICT